MIKQTIYFFVLIFFAISLHAGNATVTPFLQGEEATSVAVNTNLNALVTAINDNHARLNSLEGAAINNSVAGRSYRFSGLEAIFIADGENGTGVASNLSSTLTLSLFVNNSFTLDTVSDSAELNAEGIFPGSNARIDVNTTISEGGAWTQSGETVTLTFASQGTRLLHVLLDGSFIVSDNFDFAASGLTGLASMTSMIIGVEIQ